MNVQELILHLQELVEQDESNAEKQVKLAMQPQWPFEYSIDEMGTYQVQPTEDSVYLAEGTQLAYLDGDVAMELGW